MPSKKIGKITITAGGDWVDVKELQTELDKISDQYNAGHNLLRATYDDEHDLPRGR